METNQGSNNWGLVKLSRVIYLVDHYVSIKKRNDEDFYTVIRKKISRICY